MPSLPVYVSRNGVLIRPGEAHLSIFNPALAGAYGVYESFQVVRGQAFALAAHLERLSHSAKLIGLALPAGQAVLARWCREAIVANGSPECVLRLYVFGPENGGEAVAFIWPQPCPVYPGSFYTAGASAITFEGERALPAAKTLNGLVSYLAQRAARAAGVHEALLYHDGHLTEGSNSNLFVVAGGEVLTPPAEQVLSGVAREMVLEVLAAERLPARQTALPLADLAGWDECFITSTSRHVMPISVIDGRPVGSGEPGPLTRRIMAAFEARFERMLAAEMAVE